MLIYFYTFPTAMVIGTRLCRHNVKTEFHFNAESTYNIAVAQIYIFLVIDITFDVVPISLTH